MAAPVIQFKRGAFSNLPGLRTGEPGFTTDKYDLYVGLTSETATNKFFGSGRYWSREDGSSGLSLKLVDKDGINSINLKSPDSLSGVTTYTFPETPTANKLLLTNSSGELYFTDNIASNLNVTGVVTATSFEGDGSALTNLVSINNLVEDTTPQLGGNLDLNNKDITGTGNANITGVVTATSFEGDGSALTGVGGALTIQEEGSSLSTSATTLNFVGTNVSATGTGATKTITISGSGVSDIVDDTTPQLGGNLDLNNKDITGTGNANITGIVTATSFSGTVKTAAVQHTNGTGAATIDTSGNIVAAQNLTVTGNLYVNGSTTQVNTASMSVEDRTIELGLVDGSAPGSSTTWDLGVLFNYYDGSAKKSAVAWEQSVGRLVFASEVSDGGGTGNGSPQITINQYSPIEIGSLWVNDCAGQSQVINCSGGIRTLENITIDGGSF